MNFWNATGSYHGEERPGDYDATELESIRVYVGVFFHRPGVRGIGVKTLLLNEVGQLWKTR